MGRRREAVLEYDVFSHAGYTKATLRYWLASWRPMPLEDKEKVLKEGRKEERK